MKVQAVGMATGSASSDRLQFFVNTESSKRHRRVSDVVATAVAALLLVLCGVVAEPASGAEHAVIDLAAALPGFLAILWQLTGAVLGLWAVTILGAALAGRRVVVLLDVAIGIVLTSLLWWCVDAVVGTLPGGGHVPVALSLAAVTVGCARPHLGRPFKRVGRWLVVVATFGVILVGTTTPMGAILAILIAATASGLTHVVLGTAQGRPDLRFVAEALDGVGRPVDGLTVAPRQHAGVFVVQGTSAGRPVTAKVFGRDAQDTQFLAKAWRSLLYRGAASVMPTRTQQAEHEAFVTLLAASRGVQVPGVVAVTRTPSHDALLVLDTADDPVDHLDVERAGATWDQLDALHHAGLALRDVSLERFSIDGDGRICLGDLSTTGLAGTDDESLDRAQLLVVTAQELGIDDALDVAHARFDTDGLGALVPYLQTAALGPTLRADLRRADDAVDMEDLRSRTATRAKVGTPELAQLYRVSPRSLVQMGLTTFAAYAIISLLGGIDLDQLVTTLASASWGWVLLALLVGELPYLSETVSTQGASIRQLAAGPLVALQVAIGYVKLAVPSTAARVGMVMRYFQKQGIPAAEAGSISAIETFSGFLVQVAVLILTLGLGVGSVTLDLSADTSSGTKNLAVVLAMAVAVIVVLAIVAVAWPRMRHRLVDRVRPWLQQIRSSIGVLKSPVRVTELIGGNLLSQLLYAGALAACVQAYGADVDLAGALVVYVIASLFGGFMPVPGGIGVMEAALTVGLVAVGVSESVALAAAITFRIVTFYLPPIWGWVAFRWLERNRYL
jgi:glycosyltransferase 2 family protein